MKKNIFIATLLVFIGLHHVMAQSVLNVKSAVIAFKIKNAGLTVNGTLSGFKGEIKFSSEQFKTSSINVSVDANSINTGINSRDNHLKKEEFFDVKNFPLITIKSDFFGKDGQNFKGYFKLTIKGITKDITIPFIFDNNIMKGEFTIDRRDFKVGGNSMVMGDKVTISIQVNFANN